MFSKLLFGFTVLHLVFAKDAQDVPAMTDVDFTKYVGRWYQTHASASVTLGFEFGGNCVTADYTPTSNPKVIQVLNTVRPKLLPIIKAKAYAVASPEDGKGDLNVHFNPFANPDEPEEYKDPANYRIFGLGPVNEEGLYDWATVTDGSFRTLYILARDVERFETKYQDEVLAMVAEMGFTNTWNKPAVTNQKDCKYDIKTGDHSSVSDSTSKDLVTFDGADGTTHEFSALNDPVMGGQSFSAIKLEDGYLNIEGEVKIVPSLKAPGFVVVQSKHAYSEKFTDISGMTHLVVRMKSRAAYTGFKISLAASTWNPQFNSFKADFEVKSTGEVEEILIPFKTFSNEWDMATGESTCGKGKDCSPKDDDLKKIQQVGFWLEGFAGKFDVDLISIGATKLNSAANAALPLNMGGPPFLLRGAVVQV